jgi:hypothetical protein
MSSGSRPCRLGSQGLGVPGPEPVEALIRTPLRACSRAPDSGAVERRSATESDQFFGSPERCRERARAQRSTVARHRPCAGPSSSSERRGEPHDHSTSCWNESRQSLAPHTNARDHRDSTARGAPAAREPRTVAERRPHEPQQPPKPRPRPRGARSALNITYIIRHRMEPGTGRPTTLLTLCSSLPGPSRDGTRASNRTPRVGPAHRP